MDLPVQSYMRVISIPREIPADKPNPNTGKVYSNLEQKIEEFLEMFNRFIPVETKVITGSLLSEFMMVDPTSTIGFAVAVTDTEVIMALTGYGEHLYKSELLKNATIQFCYLADDNTGKVERVLKMILVPHLTPSQPELTAYKEESINEHGKENGGEDGRRDDQGSEGESLHPVFEV